ncbi:MAG: biosynthetic arginine decarboxylase [Planctomycetota bacterium]|nr:biosynthetic arginine decarboxylase [Planctomycetota bacterium]
MPFGTRDAKQLYGIDAWGNDYFDVNAKGHLTVHPLRDARSVDVHDLLGRLKRRKVRFPFVLRFPQMLGARVNEIFDAFDHAIREFGYPQAYRGVFPIKVNQLEPVVADLVRAGRDRGMGLEAGSKAELTVALQHDIASDSLIVCNGYKDEAYVRLALRGRTLGRNVVLIAEKPQEIDLIASVAERMGIEPRIGVRIRLRTRGSGKWERSSGPSAKFGFTTQELLDAIDTLKRYDMLDALCMIHFHAGSQITQIKRIKNAVKEGARIYAKMQAEGCHLEYLNVGGGLGVDYDGSHSSYEASMNYSVQEYANDVVYAVQEICDAENVPPPTLVSESGRALVAYHSMLVCEVKSQNAETRNGKLIVPADAHESVVELFEIWKGMTRKNHREYLHDAEEMRDEILDSFQLGYLSLRDRALTERLMRRIGNQALKYAKAERFVPEEFEQLERRLVTKYIANFSVFQSIPDSWALDQLFPVVPIHRLDERPTVEATLCDVTCDSDGEIDRFVDLRDVKDSLPLHELDDGESYYVAVLMIGAYQDVLGDYHNLFGRVDEAHVVLTKSGQPRVIHASRGDEAQDVLRLFGHDPDAMVEALREHVDDEVKARRMSRANARRALAEYKAALADYTYLDFD